MRIYWLWLALHPELKDREKAALIACFRTPEQIYSHAREEDCPEELLDSLRKARKNRDLSAAERVIEACAKEGLQIVTFQDDAYPRRLKAIFDPPLVLYCRGKLPDMDALPVIGVVGTRKASAYGIRTARRMGWELAKCGAMVVSGMALGIDAAAMTGALEAGSAVIGVLGCGAEQIYPRENRALFLQTADHGCIISEFPPGTPPSRWNFPRRNRIISGLSCGVLVVEAPEKSGSLITARQAAEQGRDVFVVPGNVDLQGFAGSYQLLREGACPAGDGWEVLREYAQLYPDAVRKDLLPLPENDGITLPVVEKAEEKTTKKTATRENIIEIAEILDKKPIDKASPRAYSDVNEILPKLTKDEQAVVLCLRQGERHADDVIAETGLTTGKFLAAMTMLELKGVIARRSGKYIRLK